MKYYLASASSLLMLEALVNRKISEGWVPLGGPMYNQNSTIYTQAITKTPLTTQEFQHTRFL